MGVVRILKCIYKALISLMPRSVPLSAAMTASGMVPLLTTLTRFPRSFSTSWTALPLQPWPLHVLLCETWPCHQLLCSSLLSIARPDLLADIQVAVLCICFPGNHPTVLFSCLVLLLVFSAASAPSFLFKLCLLRTLHPISNLSFRPLGATTFRQMVNASV